MTTFAPGLIYMLHHSNMIDITSPKVLVPCILFALLNPGLILGLPTGETHLMQTLFHALIFSILSYVIITYYFKFTMTKADIIVPALLFVLLTPGVVVTLPPNGKLFASGKSGIVPIGVHSVVFAVLYATLRGQFSQYY